MKVKNPFFISISQIILFCEIFICTKNQQHAYLDRTWKSKYTGIYLYRTQEFVSFINQ